jgi:hypothetical protein
MSVVFIVPLLNPAEAIKRPAAAVTVPNTKPVDARKLRREDGKKDSAMAHLAQPLILKQL